MTPSVSTPWGIVALIQSLPDHRPVLLDRWTVHQPGLDDRMCSNGVCAIINYIVKQFLDLQKLAYWILKLQIANYFLERARKNIYADSVTAYCIYISKPHYKTPGDIERFRKANPRMSTQKESQHCSPFWGPMRGPVERGGPGGSRRCTSLRWAGIHPSRIT